MYMPLVFHRPAAIGLLSLISKLDNSCLYGAPINHVGQILSQRICCCPSVELFSCLSSVCFLKDIKRKVHHDVLECSMQFSFKFKIWRVENPRRQLFRRQIQRHWDRCLTDFWTFIYIYSAYSVSTFRCTPKPARLRDKNSFTGSSGLRISPNGRHICSCWSRWRICSKIVHFRIWPPRILVSIKIWLGGIGSKSFG